MHSFSICDFTNSSFSITPFASKRGTLLKDAEINKFRWHGMRHDFASQLVMKGIDLNTVRELMGHADMKMTMRYAHLAPSSKLRAVEVLIENARAAEVQDSV